MKQRRPRAVYKKLIAAARRARERAYAPYSRFRVGAALLGRDGRIYSGCNVENASYGLSQCAERNALARAVAEGCRRFQAIALVSQASGPISPCGACRQALSEFEPDIEVVMAGPQGQVVVETLSRLLPFSFGPKDLKTKSKTRR